MFRKEYIEVVSDKATHLKIELYYSKGGANNWTGNNERRGIYLSVSPVTRRNYENGVVSESYTCFTGIKQLVLEMRRANQKTLDNFVIDESMKQKMIERVCKENNITLKEITV